MARDIREPVKGLDRCKYYKGEYTDNNKLSRAEECEGVFYSTDYEPIKINNYVNNGVKHKDYTVKLITNDYIPDIEIDDYVLYNEEYWLVTDIQVSDIKDNAKPFLRHSNETIIGLKKWWSNLLAFYIMLWY